jgi:hypothetical protein
MTPERKASNRDIVVGGGTSCVWTWKNGLAPEGKALSHVNLRRAVKRLQISTRARPQASGEMRTMQVRQFFAPSWSVKLSGLGGIPHLVMPSIAVISAFTLPPRAFPEVRYPSRGVLRFWGQRRMALH